MTRRGGFTGISRGKHARNYLMICTILVKRNRVWTWVRRRRNEDGPWRGVLIFSSIIHTRRKLNYLAVFAKEKKFPENLGKLLRVKSIDSLFVREENIFSRRILIGWRSCFVRSSVISARAPRRRISWFIRHDFFSYRGGPRVLRNINCNGNSYGRSTDQSSAMYDNKTVTGVFFFFF